MSEKTEIVCLCGSTRFMDNFHEAGWAFTLKGVIVLTVGVCKHAEHHGAEALGPEVAERLDELHFRKIDLADKIHVLNVEGYIGPSTCREIAYAMSKGKPVEFYEYHRGEKFLEKHSHLLGQMIAQFAMGRTPPLPLLA